MATTGATTPVQGQRKTMVGRVVSDKMDKTIVVSIERLTRHRLYKRVVRLTSKFKAHDEGNEARVGDTVLIEESRPLSATKRWRLVEIVSRAGEGAATDVVGGESDPTSATHAAAHPGGGAAADVASEPGWCSSSSPASSAPTTRAPARSSASA